jgi:hypothetical protein
MATTQISLDGPQALPRGFHYQSAIEALPGDVFIVPIVRDRDRARILARVHAPAGVCAPGLGAARLGSMLKAAFGADLD